MLLVDISFPAICLVLIILNKQFLQGIKCLNFHYFPQWTCFFRTFQHQKFIIKFQDSPRFARKQQTQGTEKNSCQGTMVDLFFFRSFQHWKFIIQFQDFPRFSRKQRTLGTEKNSCQGDMYYVQTMEQPTGLRNSRQML